MDPKEMFKLNKDGVMDVEANLQRLKKEAKLKEREEIENQSMVLNAMLEIKALVKMLTNQQLIDVDELALIFNEMLDAYIEKAEKVGRAAFEGYDEMGMQKLMNLLRDRTREIGL